MKIFALFILFFTSICLVNDEEEISPAEAIDCKQFGGEVIDGKCAYLNEQKKDCAKNTAYRDSKGNIVSGCFSLKVDVNSNEK